MTTSNPTPTPGAPGESSSSGVQLLSRRWRLLDLIAEEVARAEAKHPTWPTDPIHGVAVLAEEAGEAVKAALQLKYEGGSLEDLVKELVQTGAMAVRFLENLAVPAFDRLPVRTCRVCKCTEADCSQCIARTGSPCSWIAPDLCSACKVGD